MSTILQKRFPHFFSYEEGSYLTEIRKKRLDAFWLQSVLLDPQKFQITFINLSPLIHPRILSMLGITVLKKKWQMT